MTGTFSCSQFIQFTFDDFMLKEPISAEKLPKYHKTIIVDPAQRLADAIDGLYATEEEAKKNA